MIKVNEYFDGNIKSIGTESEGSRFTVGIMDPGIYTIPTEFEEHVTITFGRCKVQISGKEWINAGNGDTFIVPAKAEVTFKVDRPVAYICLYK